MANPTQSQIDKLSTNATRWDNIINGSASATVALDSFTVKTVAGYLQDLQATNPRGSWGTGTVYALKDIVVESSTVYICTIAHTGGTFSTDLSAGKWAIYQLDVTSAITFGNDFTVDTNTLHVDSTNNRVGIGTVNPSQQFEIVGSNSREFQFYDGKVYLQGTSTAWANKYGFKASDGTDLGGLYGYGDGTSLNYFSIGTAYNDGNLTVDTTNQRVGIGTVNPSQQFEIVASNDREFQFYDGKVFLKGSNASWACKYGFKATDGADLGGLYAYGNGTSLNYFNIGTAYNDGMLSIITSTGSVGMGTVAPSSKAVLTLSSTTKGFLLPRMSETQRDAISTPPEGLMLYNTTDNKLNVYTGVNWEEISSYA